jgi:hypothetical protein
MNAGAVTLRLLLVLSLACPFVSACSEQKKVLFVFSPAEQVPNAQVSAMLVNGALTAFFTNFVLETKVKPPASGALSFRIIVANSVHPRLYINEREVWAPEIPSYAEGTESPSIPLTKEERAADSISLKLTARLVPGEFIGGLQRCEVYDR